MNQSKCPVCDKAHQQQILFNNRIICHRCDELTFDIEMECDEIEARPSIRLRKGDEQGESTATALHN